MEGILTLIIIIIVFNLFNFLARSLKGDRSSQKGRILVEKEEPVIDHPGQVDAGRNDEQSYDSFFDMRQNADPGKEWKKTYPKKETDMPAVEETKRKAVKNKSSSVRLSGNLKQLLTQKDPFLTAFIFHEIIDPPRTRRRKP